MDSLQGQKKESLTANNQVEPSWTESENPSYKDSWRTFMNRGKKGFIPKFMEIVYRRAKLDGNPSITGKRTLVAMCQLETKKCCISYEYARSKRSEDMPTEETLGAQTLEIYGKQSIWIQRISDNRKSRKRNGWMNRLYRLFHVLAMEILKHVKEAIKK